MSTLGHAVGSFADVPSVYGNNLNLRAIFAVG
ncbi:hypothetical protein CGLO_16359 [Colletotrichum gloeosporioides Cg-14]|uniref:Uncharacterized protein n=1 Tax=Colletotrichum gloeosporioides (strain Cg-14) TaxID=1237896 RepID=T0L9I0_COLGC|nr:hypothetical protein CGLO_16359 [Colletotrichum gloeosporioides Cg-14]